MRNTVSTLGLLLCMSAAPAAGQAWDSPSFFAPRPGEDIGVFVTVPEDEFGDVGVQAIWRQEGNLNLGVRGGFGGHSDNRAILLGAEFYGNLPIGGTYPINATWIVGLGAGFDDDITALRVPLGISVGTYLGQGAMRIQPYVHPRVAFDLVAIDTGDDEETETDFSFAIDIGADLDLSERWAVKAGYTFSFGRDFDTSFDFYGNTFGAGIVYRMPRRVRSN